MDNRNMIAYLEGKIIKKEAGRIVLLVNGVGYEVLISLQTYKKLPSQGENTALFIHTNHREDAFQLFGFSNEAEKDLFRILISVSGIGPKMALSVLSHLEPEVLKKAVRQQDPDLLTGIGGIGKKRAEKLVFELKEKMEGLILESGATPVRKDLIEALENLGYSYKEAADMVGQTKIDPVLPLDEMLKKILSAGR